MQENFTIYEEFPLYKRQNSQCTKKKKDGLKGPLRVLKLCILGIIVPCTLAILILYIRYRVYVEQLYPLAMSDMRMLDSRVSTTWCQRQRVKVNATFNAYLLPNSPNIVNETKPLTMVRQLILEDDTKEYWGFYLLRGSTVTISTCCRWPGASLIVIRGHKHLHECAYIGDNSSEELDEIAEAINDGTYVPTNNSIEDAKSNEPDKMKRHRIDVHFHHSSHNSTSITDILDTTDITDPKQFRELLNLIHKLKKENQNEKPKREEEDDGKNHVHVHRNSTVVDEEKNNVKFIHENNTKRYRTESEEIIQETLKKLQKLGAKGEDILEKLNKQFKNEDVEQKNEDETLLSIRGRNYAKPPVHYSDNIDSIRRKRELIISTIEKGFNQHDEENDIGVEEGFTPDDIADHRGTINETTLNDKSNSEFWSSFSSSEEALLNCAGLILNLPLTPHTQCLPDTKEEHIDVAYIENTVTYKVPVNGYYFFVFNSENEVDPNYIRVKFNIHKTKYNVTNPVSTCLNTNESCALDLNFFSNEKLIMELPIKENEDLWNEEYVVVSDCEPRTALYIAFVIAIPIMVIIFAFQ